MNSHFKTGDTKKKVDFILVGVGGQGTLLASNLLAHLGMINNYDVKKAEVHGMSQRGGSVISHVRWADKVLSMIIPKGTADFYIAFEQGEAVRSIEYLSPQGQAIINDHRILPITVSSGLGDYPNRHEISRALLDYCPNILWVNAGQIAKEIGNQSVANLVLMGTLSHFLDISISSWDESINMIVPAKYLKINKKAFGHGRRMVKNNAMIS